MAISFIVLLSCFAFSLTLHEECFTKGKNGICLPFLECLPAKRLILQLKDRPDICEFIGPVAIVCCPLPVKTHYRSTHLYLFQHQIVHQPTTAKNPPLRYSTITSSTSVPFEDPRYQQTTTSKNSELHQTTSTTFSTIEDATLPQTTPTTTVLPSRNSGVRPNSDASSNHEDTDLPLSVRKCLEYNPEPEFHTTVTGGEESLPMEFPHVAVIGFGDENNKKWLCGGSLISKKFVLTAAHCLNHSEQGEAKWVRLGDLDLSTDTDDALPQDFSIVRRIAYPQYNPPAKYHDIAVVELNEKPLFTLYVGPACLQTKKQINETGMTAIGWGQIGFLDDPSPTLMKVELNETSAAECMRAYNNSDKSLLPNGIVDQIQICAGGVIGKDTCGGDSGGPLQVKNPTRSFTSKVHNVVGITSFGKACGLSSAPGVYTRVSYYINWLESIIWPEGKEDEDDEIVA